MLPGLDEGPRIKFYLLTLREPLERLGVRSHRMGNQLRNLVSKLSSLFTGAARGLPWC